MTAIDKPLGTLVAAWRGTAFWPERVRQGRTNFACNAVYPAQGISGLVQTACLRMAARNRTYSCWELPSILYAEIVRLSSDKL